MESIEPHVTAKCPFFNVPEEKRSRWGESLDAEKMKKCRWLNPRVALVNAPSAFTVRRLILSLLNRHGSAIPRSTTNLSIPTALFHPKTVEKDSTLLCELSP